MVDWTPDRMVQRFGERIVKVAQANMKGKRILMTVAQYW